MAGGRGWGRFGSGGEKRTLDSSRQCFIILIQISSFSFTVTLYMPNSKLLFKISGLIKFILKKNNNFARLHAHSPMWMDAHALHEICIQDLQWTIT